MAVKEKNCGTAIHIYIDNGKNNIMNAAALPMKR